MSGPQRFDVDCYLARYVATNHNGTRYEIERAVLFVPRSDAAREWFRDRCPALGAHVSDYGLGLFVSCANRGWGGTVTRTYAETVAFLLAGTSIATQTGAHFMALRVYGPEDCGDIVTDEPPFKFRGNGPLDRRFYHD